jgi:hypothetical protein
MKRIVFAILFIFMLGWIDCGNVFGQSGSKLTEFCAASAGDDATYLKDFTIELESVGADGKAPEQRFTMLLSKNTEYRFTICNAEGSGGKAVLQLLDLNRVYASSYNPSTGQTYQSINFQCNKTGAYHLIVNFVDGKKGSAVAIVSFIRTL